MRTKVLANNWFLIKLSIKEAPFYCAMFLLETVIHQVTMFLEFTLAFNYVLEAAEQGRPYRQVGIFLGLLFAFVIARIIFGAWYNKKIQPRSRIRINQKLRQLLYQKAKEIDLERYDDPEFYNSFILSLSEADRQIDQIFSLMGNLVAAVTVLLTTGAFFLWKDPASVFFVLIPVIATFFLMKVINQLLLKIRMELNPHERKRSYAGRIFYLADYAKELRLNPDAGDIIEADFLEAVKNIKRIEKGYGNKRTSLWFTRDYIINSLPQDVFYILYLVYKAVVLKTISLGSVAVLFGSVRRLKHSFRMFTEIYPQAAQISLFVDKINEFLNMETKIRGSKSLPMSNKPGTLEFKNVSFAYNKNDGYILKNINMTIYSGEKCALVGYNGAGKTTLIKLIMRLYDPTEGEILLDGVNIKEYDPDSYRASIGAVFQDYKLYAASVLENVLLDVPGGTEDEEAGAIRALKLSGFMERLDSLPEGIHTPLTTEFEENGINLSGGESQKVAIARVFNKDAQIIILDEPSSALDPISEYHLNESMLSRSGDKTVIFISHRLSTTRDANMIYMLEDGEIIEKGTHQELIEAAEANGGGKYAAMWRFQAGQYQRSEP